MHICFDTPQYIEFLRWRKDYQHACTLIDIYAGYDESGRYYCWNHWEIEDWAFELWEASSGAKQSRWVFRIQN